MGKKDEGQLSLFDLKTRDIPKVKIQPCNQYECNKMVRLVFDEEDGVYIGNRTCSHCRRAYRFKYADCL